MLTDFQELWITSRKGVLPKLNELESINVAKTCERLRLAITQPRNGLQHTLDVTRKLRTEELTFRNVSCLCYTTLRVHELQVNDLLNRTATLVAQSRDWSTVNARKRSQQSVCSASYRSKRKRRQAIEHSKQDISITNYTQLLDETENFVEWSKTDEVVNRKVTKANNHCRTTCIHIREITINEVDLHTGCYSVDEEEGFGNATADDITTFLQMLSDTPAAREMEAKPIKRKAIDTTSSFEKSAKISKGSENEKSRAGVEYPDIESVRIVEAIKNDGMNNHFIHSKEMCPKINSLVNASSDNTQFNVTAIAEMSIIDENNGSCNAVNNSIFNEAIETTIPHDQGSSEKVQYGELSTTCNHEQQQSCAEPGKSMNISKSKSKQIIIDECTELTHTEMRTQLQAQVNFKTKLRKIRAGVKWNKKRHCISGKSYENILPSANELLATLNRSCITMRKFKIKPKAARKSLDNSQAPLTYRNLLRDILSCEITDDLATEIYKNWNKIEENRLKNRHQRLPNPKSDYCIQEENDSNQIPLEPNPNNSTTFNNNNNLECVADNCVQDEWGAFDVMVKLLNLWRSKNVLGDEIPVEYLLQPAIIVRKQAAKGFAALLKLAASGFIVLLSTQYSMQLHLIKLGAASVKLIQRSEVNGMPLRRAHNAYRIHAS